MKGFNGITRSLVAITFKSRKLKSREFKFSMAYLVQYSPLVSRKLILLSPHYIDATGLVNKNKIIKSELQDKYKLIKRKPYVLMCFLFYFNVIRVLN